MSDTWRLAASFRNASAWLPQHCKVCDVRNRQVHLTPMQYRLVARDQLHHLLLGGLELIAYGTDASRQRFRIFL